MGHYDVAMMGQKGKESKKVSSIHIDIAENGYKYCVHRRNMDSTDYVYSSVDEVLKALREDLKGGTINKKKDSGLMSEMKKK